MAGGEIGPRALGSVVGLQFHVRVGSMNGTPDRAMGSPRKAPPAQLRSVAWNEDVGDSELDVPGTPRTPRTSTTPGKAVSSAMSVRPSVGEKWQGACC